MPRTRASASTPPQPGDSPNQSSRSPKKILVLAGGSVKGAFQAGAVRAVLEAGFHPDWIYGISAGGMNGTFLVNEIGRQATEGQEVDWKQASQELCRIWTERITSPESLALRRGTYELGLSALRRNFEGLLDTTPLRELLTETIDAEQLLASSVGLKVGAVDVTDGRIVYAEPNFPYFLDYVMASSAIPILMPIVLIGGNPAMPYLDGGIRDVAPIRKAIADGASEIVCIACHNQELHGQSFAYGNLLALVDRAMDIAVNEILNSDLEWAEFFNALLPEDGSEVPTGVLKGYRKMKLTLIRPTAPLNVDIQAFTADDIQRLIAIGYQRGREVMEKG
ncbi:MAG: patatin-like phospholipase family protein [Sphingobacteriaceae bacterium]|nr:patatin-like phospholipase family protein [Cytophagaceae bacterium]